LQIVTANRLDDGVVVYLDPAGGWTERLGAAATFEGPDALAGGVERGKQAEAARIVVESYPIDVAQGPQGLKPLRLREEIRAVGPTVRPDLLRASA
jgi:hypothetical protein